MKLNISEYQLPKLLKNSHIPYCILDMEGLVMDANAAFVALSVADGSQLPGLKLEDCLSLGSGFSTEAARKGAASWKVMLEADGSTRRFHLKSDPVFSNENQKTACLISFMELEEQSEESKGLEKLQRQNQLLRDTNKILEEQYIESRLQERRHQHFRKALDEVCFLIVTDKEGLIREVNALFCRAVGMHSKGILGTHYSKFLKSKEDLYSEEVRHIFKQRGSWKGEMQVLKEGVPTVILDTTINPIANEVEDITGFLAIGRDVSMQRHLEALAEKERRNMMLANRVTSQKAITPQMRLQHGLKMIADHLGMDLGIVSRINARDNSYEVLVAYDSDNSLGNDRFFNFHQTVCEITYQSSDLFVVEDLMNSPFGEHPSVSFMRPAYLGVTIFHDGKRFGTLNFSSKKPVVDKYDESDQHLMKLLGQWAENEVRQMLHDEQLLTKSLELVEANSDLQQAQDELNATNEELKQNVEEIASINENLEHEKHKVQEAMNQLKEAQKQLVQAEKMSSIGQLTAGIAHEINNPVNFIAAGSQTLEIIIHDIFDFFSTYHRLEEAIRANDESLESILKEIEEKREVVGDIRELQEDASYMMGDIDKGVARVVEIIKGLKNFVRKDDDKREMADLHELIESSLLILHTKYRDRIEINRSYSDDLQQIECYPGPLGQVILNILNNGIDAIEGKGQLSIETQSKGKEVLLKISDTGEGMPPEVMSKIFDPFFTTKDVGKGTGLGLSVSHGIIERHQGCIQVKSEIGEGTTFAITLPKKN